tara:strand:- start:845 stop:1423 length:579 start_codon:yes stop_codon:yes gene_type:complete
MDSFSYDLVAGLVSGLAAAFLFDRRAAFAAGVKRGWRALPAPLWLYLLWSGAAVSGIILPHPVGTGLVVFAGVAMVLTNIWESRDRARRSSLTSPDEDSEVNLFRAELRRAMYGYREAPASDVLHMLALRGMLELAIQPRNEDDNAPDEARERAAFIAEILEDLGLERPGPEEMTLHTWFAFIRDLAEGRAV